MTPEPECDPQPVVEFLRALAHPMRLRILERLLEGELAVSGFEQELGFRQPGLSQQLGALREAGLVATRREAKSIIYSIADERVAPMLDALCLVRGGGHVMSKAASSSPRPAVVKPVSTIGPMPSRAKVAVGSAVFGQVGWHLGAGE